MIRFYRTREPHGEFSNFARFPLRLDGKDWPTAEHYFQAQKFHDPAYRERIRLAPTARQAAELGRSRDVPLRGDWETVKDNIMRQVVHAKVTQHSAIRDLLLSTGEEDIVEHTSNDAYWGDGGDGLGANKLGKILMEVRARLRGAGA